MQGAGDQFNPGIGGHSDSCDLDNNLVAGDNYTWGDNDLEIYLSDYKNIQGDGIGGTNCIPVGPTDLFRYRFWARTSEPVQPQVAAGERHTVGLKTDGTVVAVGENNGGQCNVSNWEDIIQVDAGGGYTVGLKSNGRVVAVGYNWYHGELNFDSWEDIVQVAAGYGHTVGLKSNGTVVAAGMNGSGQLNVDSWEDIVQVAAGEFHTVGVKSNGKVVAVGCGGGDDWGQCDVNSWTDITQVAAWWTHTVGLKSNGKVVAVGDNRDGQLNVGSWTNIAQVDAGWHTVGLKTDGTVVAVGWNEGGQCNVSNWEDIIQVAAGRSYTVGLKTDGTVVAVGENDSGQCNVFDWNLIVTENTPPDAICQYVTVSTESGLCTADASVDDGSFDPDGDPITLDQAPPGPYDLGDTEVTLTVTDDNGLFDTCDAIVTVEDEEAPVIISMSASPNELWPPNHKMVPVTVAVAATDNCDFACQIVLVESNESVNGLGDGNTTPDWIKTGDLTVKLRAERSGTGNGRVYTITVSCTDQSENSSTDTATVAVPHDKGKNNNQKNKKKK
jgi:alpha-tubulin suppressor-like RCC1 family protein